MELLHALLFCAPIGWAPSDVFQQHANALRGGGSSGKPGGRNETKPWERGTNQGRTMQETSFATEAATGAVACMNAERMAIHCARSLRLQFLCTVCPGVSPIDYTWISFHKQDSAVQNVKLSNWIAFLTTVCLLPLMCLIMVMDIFNNSTIIMINN